MVVVGAGPAGLTAARELAARDFKVTVLEQGSAPGGQLILAKAPPLKEKIGWLIEYLTRQAIRQGADIQYNINADREIIESFHPYAVFLATGGEAAAPKNPRLRIGRSDDSDANPDRRKEVLRQGYCSGRLRYDWA